MEGGASGAQLWRNRDAGARMHAAAKLGNGGARSGAWPPRSHFIEYVARVAVPDLESVFGIFGADSDLGAYRKVAVLRMLFDFD